jgi:hypothetical protein
MSPSKGNDTMAHAAFTIAPGELRYSKPPTDKLVSRGLLRRLFDAMIASRQRQAEREIAWYFQRTGGKFTDTTEREIERHFPPTRSFW